MALNEFLQQQLEQQRAADLYRQRRVIEGSHGVRIRVDGRECLNFCSNDYLGLAADPRLAEAARRALDDSGVGSGAAALVSGYNRHHRTLEETVAEYLGAPRALLFSSGWAANLGVIRALLGRASWLLADELNHASLIDGGRLSGAHYRRIAHADADAFAAAMAAAPQGADSRSIATLAVTDAVFSMDGDLAPLAALSRSAKAHQVPLMVDDAHGFGVLGPNGRGAFDALSVALPDIYVATLGKAAGASGAFVAGSEELIEYLIQRGRTWVFSTAPPPAMAAAATAAIRIMEAEPEHRRRLMENIAYLQQGAQARELPLGSPAVSGDQPQLPTPIQPLLIGDAAQAMTVSADLMQQGFWVAAIRPPTVPAGTSRLRITLSAAHTREQIDALLDALRASLRQRVLRC